MPGGEALTSVRPLLTSMTHGIHGSTAGMATCPPASLPSTESLKDTSARTLPYWERELLPRLREGRTVLVAAHGNSLRALVKHLDGISDETISEVNIPTGIPLVYEMDGDAAIGHRFLASDDELAKATEKAAAVR